jgi:hypothetical protein
MNSLLASKAAELQPQMRAALESEFGRALRDDEEVRIMASPPTATLTEEERREAWRRLDQSLRVMEDRWKDVPVDEYEEILLEAIRSVRPNYRPIR